MFAGKQASAPGAHCPTLRLLAAAALLAAVLGGCVPYELKQVLDGPQGKPLAISPAQTVVPVNGTVSFAAEGGIPPYVFSIASGGGVLDSATGAYTSSSIGAATIRVTDKTGKGVDATVAVQAYAAGLTISPAALSLAVGSNVTFSATGGTPPYTFAIQTNSSGSLSAGASGVTNWLYVPGGTSGGVDVISLTDSSSASVTASVTVTALSSSVDYSVPASSFLPTGTVSTTIPGAPSFTLHNGGSAAGAQTVDWKVYLSANGVLDGGDLLIASGTTGALAAGASFSVPVTGSYPAVSPGSGWNLIVQASAADDTTTANNTSGAVSLTLNPQDINYTVPGVSHSAGTAAGLAMSGTFTIKNVGTAAGVAGTTWTVYASTDTVLDGLDYLVASGTQAALGAGITSGPINFSGYWPSTPGTWYLLATVSASDDVGPGNNTAASSAVTTIGAAPGNVDYTVVSVASAGVVAGDPLSGSFTAHNGGTDPGAQPVYWTAYLSSNATLEVGTDPVIDSGMQPALGAGATSGTITFSGTWPAAPGIWRLIVALSSSDDSVPGNNMAVSVPVSTVAPSVDYVVWTINSTGGTTAGGSLGGTLTIKNTGSHAGSQVVPWAVYLSTDGSLNIGTDQLFATGSVAAPGLAAGAVSSSINFTGTWPASNVAHTYFFIGTVGAGDDVNPGDDAAPSGPITVNPPDIDYSVASVSNAGGTTGGGPVSGTFTVHNNGTAGGTATLTWIACISANSTYEITDQVIDAGTTGALPGGGTSGAIGFAGMWPAGAGSWHLIVKVSASDDINTANDAAASALITVLPPAPAYTITSVPLPAGTAVSAPVSGNFTIQNNGTGPGGAAVNWQVYASQGNTTYDAFDTLIASGSIGGLGIGASSSPAYSGTWPPTAGTWFIIVRASAADAPAVADAPSGGVAVVVVAQPNYMPNFPTDKIPWTGVVGTAMSLTRPCQFDIYNISGNNGLANITWAVYLSTDRFLDGGDALIQQGTVGPLAANASTTVSFDGTWPATGTYWLIFKVHSTDDSFAGNDVIFAPHPSVIGNYRYVEDGTWNDDGSLVPSWASLTGVTLGAGQTLVIEATMDAYPGSDTFQFDTTASRLSVRADWSTDIAANNLDLTLWHLGGTGVNQGSNSGGAESEPDVGTMDTIFGIPAGTYFVNAYMWMDEGATSPGWPYTILVKAQ